MDLSHFWFGGVENRMGKLDFRVDELGQRRDENELKLDRIPFNTGWLQEPRLAGVGKFVAAQRRVVLYFITR
jgi:hypothetical protein